MASTALRLAAGITLAAASLTAFAQANPPTVEITGVVTPLPDAATMSAMTGDFRLSDGRTLRIVQPGLHLMAAVGPQWAVTVEPRGANRFVSRDGSLELVFEPDAQGSFDRLTLRQGRAVNVAVR